MLKTRVITALVLLAVLLPILFLLPAMYVDAFFLVALLAAAWEWSRLLAPEVGRAAWLYALFCLAIILFLLGMQNASWQFALLLLAVIFWFFVAPFILAKGINLSLEKLRPFYVVLGLILLPATWFALVFLRELGLIFLLSSMALVWIADIGAYFVGKAFGKHKLAVQISPGKSIEGAIGGLILCYVYAFLCVYFLPFESTLFGAWAIRFGWVPMFLMVTVLTAFSIFGDLFESQLKRLAGVKDSSHLLPGHGGVLDRVDALIPAMPIAALLAGFV
ncbi:MULTISPECIES: phosphatidate cytidylyltransferase [unclassified Polynucleobacter]|jgi:phosphatidate cytidylyltransferase|uniref:phosphatidate cytidylyltransferase n=1 Tax=unclassified Polynucleobacter TaxID=2640945 RepID=UPI000926E43F|nr:MULTISPECIES: phosphatidate cytidylyltransferase [unclassified Polynucleobacter]MEA9567112.1 phosphatidate cytidylyltransferase [Polynucleobacter sp. AP-Nickl1-40-C4]OJI04985.1 phosphatidate cytidylyltransferase [Polynucleobacter sp. MWH-Adler-W8]